jgi:hypothetical protein
MATKSKYVEHMAPWNRTRAARIKTVCGHTVGAHEVYYSKKSPNAYGAHVTPDKFWCAACMRDINRQKVLQFLGAKSDELFPSLKKKKEAPPPPPVYTPPVIPACHYAKRRPIEIDGKRLTSLDEATIKTYYTTRKYDRKPLTAAEVIASEQKLLQNTAARLKPNFPMCGVQGEAVEVLVALPTAHDDGGETKKVTAFFWCRKCYAALKKAAKEEEK